jgi:hypothetical protein
MLKVARAIMISKQRGRDERCEIPRYIKRRIMKTKAKSIYYEHNA